MIKKLRGVVHGRTVELEEDPGIPDGQAVSVDLEMDAPAAAPRVEKTGWGRLEGILADYPEWDEIMEQIHQQRKLERRPQMEGLDG